MRDLEIKKNQNELEITDLNKKIVEKKNSYYSSIQEIEESSCVSNSLKIEEAES